MEFMQELNEIQDTFHLPVAHYIIEGPDGTRGQSHPWDNQHFKHFQKEIAK